MKIEAGKSYQSRWGALAWIMGPTKDNPEWLWSIQGNWYEASTGYMILTTFQGEKYTMPKYHGNLVTEVDDPEHPARSGKAP